MSDPTHADKVAGIARQVAEHARRKESLHVQKGGVHHFVPLPGDRRFRGRPIDISGLNRVLSIDRDSRQAVAEPGVTFAALVEQTLAVGLLPKLVPELEGITVGGAIAGCSVESMSYRYGGFHDGCLEYEVVSGAGEVLRVSRDKDPLVFGMTHGSYGTLGLLTEARFELVPAKRYVRLEYQRYDSAEALLDAMHTRARGGDQDFIDAIVHGPKHHILCLGRFADQAPQTSDYTNGEIFYRSTAQKSEDWLTTRDYCFRYDTECHWLTRTVPPLEWKPVRKLVGRWFLGSTNLITWSKRLEAVLKLKRRPDVVVDLFIPEGRYLEFFRWYAERLDYYPLWLVPYRVPEPYPWITPEHNARIGEWVIDCAIYGKPNGEAAVDYSELLEEKTFELGGIKTLISANHYQPERFWSIYHRQNYDAMKARLDPAGLFPGLYEKFNR
jgi:FAD/FMN-containing dehydrogenase